MSNLNKDVYNRYLTKSLLKVYYCDSIRLRHVPDQAKEAMDLCLSIFLNERDYHPERRRAVVERVCIPFLLHTSTAARRKFYLGHIKNVMAVIEAKQLRVKIISYMTWDKC